jgi:hypothetical protein
MIAVERLTDESQGDRFCKEEGSGDAETKKKFTQSKQFIDSKNTLA